MFTSNKFLDSMGKFTLDRVDPGTVDAIMEISKNFKLSSYKDYNELLDLE